MNQASTVADSDVRAAVGLMLARAYNLVKYAVQLHRIQAEARAHLAMVFHAEDTLHPEELPGVTLDPRVQERFCTVRDDLFRSLGVEDGTRIPNALRAQVLAALGFREPPAPAWLVPGYTFFAEWRGLRGEAVTIVRVTPEGVVLRGPSGYEEEPVPMGLFLAAHPVQPPRLYEKNVVYLNGKPAGRIVSAEARVDYDKVLRAYEDTYGKAASQLLLGQTLTGDVPSGEATTAFTGQWQEGNERGTLTLCGSRDDLDRLREAALPTVSDRRFSRLAKCLGVPELFVHRLEADEPGHDGGPWIWAHAAGLRKLVDALAWRLRQEDAVDVVINLDPGEEINGCGTLRVELRGEKPKQDQPEPAPHQVRRTQAGGDVVVVSVGEEQAVVRGHDGQEGRAQLHYFHDWPCIGVELADGRRMLVDETWEYTPPKGGNCGSKPVRHVFRGVARRRWDGEVCFVEDGGLFSFAYARHDPPDRWRKVEKTGESLDASFAADTVKPLYDDAVTLARAARATLPSPEGLAALHAFFTAIVKVVGSEAFCRDAYRRQVEAAMAGASLPERAAILAACERHRPFIGQIPDYLAALRRYEAGRARGMTPARARLEMGGFDVSAPSTWSRVGLDAYERARGTR